MEREEFERIVLKLIDELPERFRKDMENVSIVLEERPSLDLLRKVGVRSGKLLGIYQGVPLTKRGLGYNGVLPDRIILFMREIEEEARMENVPLVEKIKNVLYHEIGHYFGLSEEELRKLGVF
ncbi:MAG TPA: metallopeptidase family protein [Firmicutes bacterium]|nr:metallopeptidase family protein [Caldisericia bacterium]HDJ99880.1 metallopeptidase family protein [Bacillota bacterium]